MTIQERLAKKLATGISRRGFIKGLGMFTLAFGAALMGKTVEEATAESWCCTGTPQCSGCQGGGSICPSGYHSLSHNHCCLNYCQYMCLECERYVPYDHCWCYHDDMVSCGGGNCGSKQGTTSQQSTGSSSAN
jgi:hypothetical protein